MTRRLATALVLVPIAWTLAGCAEGVDATYGRVAGPSVNGTGALASLFRARGDEVRVSLRLNEEVGDWAQTIVRFAPYPGPPSQGEAEWYDEWLGGDENRRLIYVPQDFDAESEFWSAMLAKLPKDAPAKTRERAEHRRDETKGWDDDLPPPVRDPVASEFWFGVEPAKSPPMVCKRLGGPWSDGIDPAAAVLTRHGTLKPWRGARVLLEGDGAPLVLDDGSSEPQMLIIANGSFLLNMPLVNRARRPLARRVLDWAGEPRRRVVFVESRSPADPGQGKPPSVFALLWIEPFGWIAAHLGAFGLIACLAAAARLGRPRPEPPSGADRPAAHAEALGDLLARTRDAGAARALLESYRRWRQAAPGPTSTSTRRGGLL